MDSVGEATYADDRGANPASSSAPIRKCERGGMKEGQWRRQHAARFDLRAAARNIFSSGVRLESRTRGVIVGGIGMRGHFTHASME